MINCDKKEQKFLLNNNNYYVYYNILWICFQLGKIIQKNQTF